MEQAALSDDGLRAPPAKCRGEHNTDGAVRRRRYSVLSFALAAAVVCQRMLLVLSVPGRLSATLFWSKVRLREKPAQQDMWVFERGLLATIMKSSASSHVTAR